MWRIRLHERSSNTLETLLTALLFKTGNHVQRLHELLAWRFELAFPAGVELRVRFLKASLFTYQYDCYYHWQEKDYENVRSIIHTCKWTPTLRAVIPPAGVHLKQEELQTENYVSRFLCSSHIHTTSLAGAWSPTIAHAPFTCAVIVKQSGFTVRRCDCRRSLPNVRISVLKVLQGAQTSFHQAHLHMPAVTSIPRLFWLTIWTPIM